ncbi:MAG TPA: hypothetical protein VF765_29135 [Polyangiaceae bacterium]
MDRKRLLRLLFLAAGLAVAMLLARHWPKEQTVHYVLGDGAARVEEVDARWAQRDEARASEDWTREATFRYAPGQAPRIVTHEPRLPDGDYTVEIEIASASTARNVVRRNVTLSGSGSTSIDLADSVPR